jgi:hypothetical protein
LMNKLHFQDFQRLAYLKSKAFAEKLSLLHLRMQMSIGSYYVFKTAVDAVCFQKKRNLLHINVLRSSAYIMSDEVL